MEGKKQQQGLPSKARVNPRSLIYRESVSISNENVAKMFIGKGGAHIKPFQERFSQVRFSVDFNKLVVNLSAEKSEVLKVAVLAVRSRLGSLTSACSNSRIVQPKVKAVDSWDKEVSKPEHVQKTQTIFHNGTRWHVDGDQAVNPRLRAKGSRFRTVRSDNFTSEDFSLIS